MSTVNELLELANKEINNLKLGEVFLVRDLFKGYEWRCISHNERLSLLIFNYVKNVDINIILIEKASSGQQKYRMKLGSEV